MGPFFLADLNRARIGIFDFYGCGVGQSRGVSHCELGNSKREPKLQPTSEIPIVPPSLLFPKQAEGNEQLQELHLNPKGLGGSKTSGMDKKKQT